jgi:hypothetical protein
MTPNLTAPNKELNRLVRQTPEGMMFWSGTCSDPTATCGGCRHFGYEVVIRNEAGNAVDTRGYPNSCALYRKYTGRHGKPFDEKTAACKYFEFRQLDNTHMRSARACECNEERHEKRNTKMDMTQYSSSNFIKFEDVVGDSPRRETIVDVVIGNFERPNLVFESGDMLSLNKSNTRILVKAYGKDSRNWPGHIVELCAGHFDYKGQKTDGVIVQPLSATPPTESAQDDPEDEVPF